MIASAVIYRIYYRVSRRVTNRVTLKARLAPGSGEGLGPPPSNRAEPKGRPHRCKGKPSNILYKVKVKVKVKVSLSCPFNVIGQESRLTGESLRLTQINSVGKNELLPCIARIMEWRRWADITIKFFAQTQSWLCQLLCQASFSETTSQDGEVDPFAGEATDSKGC
jgi:hypothetical protein